MHGRVRLAAFALTGKMGRPGTDAPVSLFIRLIGGDARAIVRCNSVGHCSLFRLTLDCSEGVVQHYDFGLAIQHGFVLHSFQVV